MHTFSFRVRTYECDSYGHVNNAVYLNYLEYGRDMYLQEKGLDYQALVASGNGIWVSEAKLFYQSPAHPGEDLVLSTQPHEMGAAWVVLKQSLHGPEGRPVLEAYLKLVWVGSTGRPTRIPIEWKHKLGLTIPATKA